MTFACHTLLNAQPEIHMRRLLLVLALLAAGCSTHHGSVKELLVGQTPICMPPCASPCAILPEGWTMSMCGECTKPDTIEVPAHVFEGTAFRPRVTHTEPTVEVPTRVFDTTGLRHAPISEVPTVQVPAAVFDEAGLHRAPVEVVIEAADEELGDEPAPVPVIVTAEQIADAVNRRKALEAELERMRELEAERMRYAPAHPGAQPPPVPPPAPPPAVVPEIGMRVSPMRRVPCPPPPPPPAPVRRKR